MDDMESLSGPVVYGMKISASGRSVFFSLGQLLSSVASPKGIKFFQIKNFISDCSETRMKTPVQISTGMYRSRSTSRSPEQEMNYGSMKSIELTRLLTGQI